MKHIFFPRALLTNYTHSNNNCVLLQFVFSTIENQRLHQIKPFIVWWRFVRLFQLNSKPKFILHSIPVDRRPFSYWLIQKQMLKRNKNCFFIIFGEKTHACKTFVCNIYSIGNDENIRRLKLRGAVVFCPTKQDYQLISLALSLCHFFGGPTIHAS